MTIDSELCCIYEFQLMAEECEVVRVGRDEEIDALESCESMKSTSATNNTAITTEEFERCASDRIHTPRGTRHSRKSLT